MSFTFYFKNKFHFIAEVNPFTRHSRVSMTQKKKAFENNVVKGDNAGNKHFVLFPKCFPPIKDRKLYKLHIDFCQRIVLI